MFVTILAGVVAAVAVAAGCGGANKTAKAASSSPSLRGGLDPLTPPPAWVMKIVAPLAKMGGDAHPAYAGWTLVDVPVGHDMKQALIVVLHGDFTSLSFTHPLGYTPPRVIHWIKLTLDPETQSVSVLGLTQKGPSAKLAGRLQPFKL